MEIFHFGEIYTCCNKMYINTISVCADCSVDIADTSGSEGLTTMSSSLRSIFYKQQLTYSNYSS